MISRCALFIGTVKPGLEAQMRAHVEAQLAPLWRKFEGAAAVRVLYAHKLDDNGPAIPLVLQVDYHSRADIDRALASPARFKSRDMLPAFYEQFWDQVQLVHHEYEIG